MIRLVGDATSTEIQNEARAVEKLSQSGMKNVVTVIGFGKFLNSPYFFFDMELCDFNLENYIFRRLEPGLTETIDSFANPNLQGPGSHMIPIWKIMLDICCGVKFIHNLGEVHRDLKPRNGMT